MSEQIRIIYSRVFKARLVLIAAILFALIFAWFGVRWQLGNMLGELTLPSEPNAKEIANLAIDLAPSDPAAVWLAATLEKDAMTAEKIDKSVRMFEEVVRLSPHDYRWWIELGRAYEQAEKPEQAEKAFRRAVELAPFYTYPHWQIGNFYLRQGRSDEAFAALKKTTEKSMVYREQVFSLAWDYFEKDAAKVEQLVADLPDVRASLALFYAARERPEDSLRIWNMLSDQEKAGFPEYSKTISQGLNDKRFFRSALEFSRQGGIDPDVRAETVTNAGFEKPLGNPEETHFGWKIGKTDGKIDILTDGSEKHDGARSLKVTFKGYAKADLYNISQVVVVEPRAKYRLSFWLRTENLKSPGAPLLEIINGKNDKLIAASKPFPTGSNGWQEIAIDFNTPENCEGVVLRTSRAYCGESCAIFGAFWYDDFRISRQ